MAGNHFDKDFGDVYSQAYPSQKETSSANRSYSNKNSARKYSSNKRYNSNKGQAYSSKRETSSANKYSTNKNKRFNNNKETIPPIQKAAEEIAKNWKDFWTKQGSAPVRWSDGKAYEGISAFTMPSGQYISFEELQPLKGRVNRGSKANYHFYNDQQSRGLRSKALFNINNVSGVTEKPLENREGQMAALEHIQQFLSAHPDCPYTPGESIQATFRSIAAYKGIDRNVPEPFKPLARDLAANMACRRFGIKCILNKQYANIDPVKNGKSILQIIADSSGMVYELAKGYSPYAKEQTARQVENSHPVTLQAKRGNKVLETMTYPSLKAYEMQRGRFEQKFMGMEDVYFSLDIAVSKFGSDREAERGGLKQQAVNQAYPSNREASSANKDLFPEPQPATMTFDENGPVFDEAYYNSLDEIDAPDEDEIEELVSRAYDDITSPRSQYSRGQPFSQANLSSKENSSATVTAEQKVLQSRTFHSQPTGQANPSNRKASSAHNRASATLNQTSYYPDYSNTSYSFQEDNYISPEKLEEQIAAKVQGEFLSYTPAAMEKGWRPEGLNAFTKQSETGITLTVNITEDMSPSVMREQINQRLETDLAPFRDQMNAEIAKARPGFFGQADKAAAQARFETVKNQLVKEYSEMESIVEGREEIRAESAWRELQEGLAQAFGNGQQSLAHENEIELDL